MYKSIVNYLIKYYYKIYRYNKFYTNILFLIVDFNGLILEN